MGVHHILPRVGEAIIDILSQSCSRDEFLQARFWIQLPTGPELKGRTGLSLVMYHVTLQPPDQPPRAEAHSGPSSPKLLMDLHYLLTGWGESFQHQQALLGWAVRTLAAHPTLDLDPPGGRAGEEPSATRDIVQLHYDPIPLREMVRVRNLVGVGLHPSVTYLARGIVLD